MERRYLVNDVLDAMKKHELRVYYQPKYDATTSRLKSAEALVLRFPSTFPAGICMRRTQRGVWPGSWIPITWRMN